ncbi:MAG TPA: nuclease-related domain-containing protein [Candidatus Deferrimicrobiaceae bacterium]|jgi:hypothetical protein
MLIKQRDDRSGDVAVLRRLLEQPLTAKQRFLIERELKCLDSGVRGEDSSAYYIEFRYRNSQNWAVIHDLRLEHEGFSAQIDHLLINRFLEVYVLESKNYYYGIKINPEGEFLAWNGKSYVGIESPVEQNRRHIELLEKVIKQAGIAPTRLGIPLPVTFRSYVMVAPGARVDRPIKGKLDTSMVVKADDLMKTIDERLDSPSPAFVFAALTKVVSAETLESFAKALAFKHKRGGIDYAAKIGVPLIAATPPPLAAPPPPAPSSGGSSAKAGVCAGCGTEVDSKVVYFCRIKKERFGGKILCRECQGKYPQA